MNKLFYFISVLLFLAACGGKDNKSEVENENTEELSGGPEVFGIDPTMGVPQGLPVGIKSPGFGTRDINGSSVDLYGITQSSAVVLMFYRGNWCPHCSKHIANLSDSVDLLLQKGVRIIAITPENREDATEFTSKLNNKITVISDNTGALMKAFDVRFNVNESYQEQLISSKNMTLEEHNKSDKNFLPVPATYIIDKSGTITYRHFDLNYQNRASIREIIEAL